MILFELERKFRINNQVYLEILYKAIFILSYYGMMRIGEVTLSPHVLKACNVHMVKNKDKLLLILYSSKTHGLRHRPQKIKITLNRTESSGAYIHQHFCPFVILCQFIQIRGNYVSDEEQFFLF